MGKRNEFLFCNKCLKNFHPRCVDPPLVMKYASRFKWHCPNCKICNVCNKNTEEKLKRCGTCDRTFHDKCYTMELSQMSGKYNCVDCIKCKNCSKILPLLTTFNQNDFFSVKGYRVCDECWKYYKNVTIN